MVVKRETGKRFDSIRKIYDEQQDTTYHIAVERYKRSSYEKRTQYISSTINISTLESNLLGSMQSTAI